MTTRGRHLYSPRRSRLLGVWVLLWVVLALVVFTVVPGGIAWGAPQCDQGDGAAGTHGNGNGNGGSPDNGNGNGSGQNDSPGNGNGNGQDDSPGNGDGNGNGQGNGPSDPPGKALGHGNGNSQADPPGNGNGNGLNDSPENGNGNGNANDHQEPPCEGNGQGDSPGSGSGNGQADLPGSGNGNGNGNEHNGDQGNGIENGNGNGGAPPGNEDGNGNGDDGAPPGNGNDQEDPPGSGDGDGTGNGNGDGTEHDGDQGNGNGNGNGEDADDEDDQGDDVEDEETKPPAGNDTNDPPAEPEEPVGEIESPIEEVVPAAPAPGTGNRAPVVGGGNISTLSGQPAQVGLLGYGWDPDGDSIVVGSVAQPGHGSVNLDSVTGIATYAPIGGYVGADTFTFALCDTNGACSQGSIGVSVLALEPVPQPSDNAAPPSAPLPVEGEAQEQNEGSPETASVPASDITSTSNDAPANLVPQPSDQPSVPDNGLLAELQDEAFHVPVGLGVEDVVVVASPPVPTVVLSLFPIASASAHQLVDAGPEPVSLGALPLTSSFTGTVGDNLTALGLPFALFAITAVWVFSMDVLKGLLGIGLGFLAGWFKHRHTPSP